MMQNNSKFIPDIIDFAYYEKAYQWEPCRIVDCRLQKSNNMSSSMQFLSFGTECLQCFSAPSYKLAAFRFPLVVLQCQSSTQTPPGRAQGRAPNIKRLKYVSRPGQKEKDGHIKGAGIFHSARRYWSVYDDTGSCLVSISWYCLVLDGSAIPGRLCVACMTAIYGKCQKQVKIP